MTTTAVGARGGNETEEVWAQEEAYWRYLQEHDAEGYLALWAEDFAGWPLASEHPIRRADVAAFVSKEGFLREVTSYELQRESVEMHGPAVIAFYRVTVRRRNADGSEARVTYRMTHTWMKREGKWKIVGGMNAGDPAPKASVE